MDPPLDLRITGTGGLEMPPSPGALRLAVRGPVVFANPKGVGGAGAARFWGSGVL